MIGFPPLPSIIENESISTLKANLDVMKHAKQSFAQILVIDDEITSCQILETILQKEGFSVIVTHSGSKGREIAANSQPDLILMDVKMPEEDGLTTCAALKTDAKTANIPVVFLSAEEDINIKVKGFEVGGVDYITKPYHPAEVLARVRMHLRMYHTYQSMVSAHLKQINSLANAQQVFLPHPSEFPEAQFSVFYLPMLQAGGDFYDVFQSGSGIFDYLVADISGHDLGSSLATAALKALLRQNADMYYSPLENIQLINHNIRPLLQDGQFATLVYARLNRIRRKLIVLGAGHPPAILVRQPGEIRVIKPPGDLLGVFETCIFGIEEVDVLPGDRIYLFSDGLFEYNQIRGITREAGFSLIQGLIAQTWQIPLQEVLQVIIDKLKIKRNTIQDDVVLLAFEM